MKKGTLSNIILILMLIAGLSLLVYPSFSDYWNSLHQSRAVASYVETVTKLDNKEYERIWQEALDYNKKLTERENAYILPEELTGEYNNLLNIGGNGIMGYIDIKSIGVNLPLYHGTSESVLQVAIGHLDWTSLPTGGAGTHCVVSGHRGLPSARLFTDLDQLDVGDTFVLNILDQVLTYEVDQIKIVEPHETEDLLIQPGKDYCTLVTCTPYGINSHRMLVRGERTDNILERKEIRVTADALQIEPIIVAPLVAAPILLVLLVVLLIPKPKSNHRKGDDDFDGL